MKTYCCYFMPPRAHNVVIFFDHNFPFISKFEFELEYLIFANVSVYKHYILHTFRIKTIEKWGLICARDNAYML